MVPNDSKNPIASKTLWFNVLALLVFVAAAYGFNEFVPSGEIENLAKGIVALLGLLSPVINIGLRLVTKKAIRL